MTDHKSTDILWQKSSYSGYEECVEVAAAGGDVLLRDSRNPHGPTLTISSAAWQDFLTTVPYFPAFYFDININREITLID
ncbi:MAG: DUF397 domain-containing protein [Actinomycetota bacterium]|nr:DUF397 domain-containing protein [Actinomycetota bacterium]